MEVQRFEQAILKLAFETEARITTASVAYYLGIPSREANRLLNLLLEEGVLELDSDEDGNLFYLVPHQGEHKQAFSKHSFENLNAPQKPKLLLATPDITPPPNTIPRAENPSPGPDYNQPDFNQHDFNQPGLTPQPEYPNYHVHNLPAQHAPTDDHRLAFVHPNSPDEHTAAYTPQLRPPTPGPAPSHSRGHRATEPSTYFSGFGQDGDNAYQPGPNAHWTQTQHHAHPQAARTQTTTRENLFFGVTSRYASPDASLDQCGASPVVLNTTTRCEPQPLPDSRPTVVSCSGYEHFSNTTTTTMRDDYRFGFAANSTAMAAIPRNDYLLDNSIEQPEHQPGMALLLSLILCGTGQIYNGEVSKGIIMMVLCFLLWFVLLGWVVHIWSIVDAVVVAERINRKHN